MNLFDGLQLIEITGDQGLLSKVYKLRVEAWRSNVDLPAEMVEWTDDHDLNGRHWAVLNGQEPIASGRLSIHLSLADVPDADSYHDVFGNDLPNPIASLNRLVVHPAYRSRGLSEQIDEVRIKAAETAGAKIIIGSTGSLQSNQFRIEKLKTLGFEVAGINRPYTQGVLAHANELPNIALICRLPRPLSRPF